MTGAPTKVSHLDATRRLDAAPDVVCATLANPERLGRLLEPPAERPGATRVEMDLAFALEADRRVLTFRKAALVDIGPAVVADGRCRVEVAWQAASFAPLFPVFVGSLVADGRQLRLEGDYAPPGGGIGLLIDQTFLQYFARRTAKWFLDRVAEEVSVQRA